MMIEFDWAEFDWRSFHWRIELNWHWYLYLYLCSLFLRSICTSCLCWSLSQFKVPWQKEPGLAPRCYGRGNRISWSNSLVDCIFDLISTHFTNIISIDSNNRSFKYFSDYLRACIFSTNLTYTRSCAIPQLWAIPINANYNLYLMYWSMRAIGCWPNSPKSILIWSLSETFNLSNSHLWEASGTTHLHRSEMWHWGLTNLKVCNWMNWIDCLWLTWVCIELIEFELVLDWFVIGLVWVCAVCNWLCFVIVFVLQLVVFCN